MTRILQETPKFWRKINKVLVIEKKVKFIISQNLTFKCYKNKNKNKIFFIKSSLTIFDVKILLKLLIDFISNKIFENDRITLINLCFDSRYDFEFFIVKVFCTLLLKSMLYDQSILDRRLQFFKSICFSITRFLWLTFYLFTCDLYFSFFLCDSDLILSISHSYQSNSIGSRLIKFKKSVIALRDT